MSNRLIRLLATTFNCGMANHVWAKNPYGKGWYCINCPETVGE